MLPITVKAEGITQTQPPRQMSNYEKRKMLFRLTKEEKEERDLLLSKYSDRAAKRRELHGIDDPPVSLAPEQECEVASSSDIVQNSNPGFKLLQKMGWKEGQGLGKENSGIVDPVQALVNDGRTGLGFGRIHTADSMNNSLSETIKSKARERFKDLLERKEQEIDMFQM